MTDNFSALEKMAYSGRGITVGRTPSGNSFIGYSLTGRSPPSQARELVEAQQTRTIRTNVTNPKELEKGSPALLLYPALAVAHDIALIASNGAQTKLIYSAIFRDKTMTHAPNQHTGGFMINAFKHSHFEYDQKDDRWIDITTYEPDSNKTPRISACVINKYASMHIAWCEDGQKKEQFQTAYLEAGRGKVITTYKGGNESPLLPFKGDPLSVTITSETADDIAESIYAAIHGGSEPEDNYRVAAAVMLRNAETGKLETKVINRSERGD